MTDPVSPDPPPPVDLQALEAIARLEAAAPHLIAMKRHLYGGSIERDIRAVAAELKRLQKLETLRAAAPQRQEPPSHE